MPAEPIAVPLVERGAVEATAPRKLGQTPISARASEDLPEALGPTTPSALPARTVKVTSAKVMRWTPGGPPARFSAESRSRGAGSARGSPVSGSTFRRSLSRAQLWRADTKPRQLAMASSRVQAPARSGSSRQ